MKPRRGSTYERRSESDDGDGGSGDDEYEKRYTRHESVIDDRAILLGGHPRSHPRPRHARSYWPRILLGVGIIIAVALAFFVGWWAGAGHASHNDAPLQTQERSLAGPRDSFLFSNGSRYVRPPELKIIGIVFFGRRQFVDILDCYLRRNLAVNGGLLDEVHFLLHTDVEEDKAWLRNHVQTWHLEDHYKLMAEDTGAGWNRWQSFGELYRDFLSDPEAIYIKIDDDIVYIDDYAIRELVRTTLERPDAHSVVSNNINNRWNYWYHRRTGAINPYLPDRDADAKWPIDSWRPSELPKYLGGFQTDNATLALPFQGHRWLPLELDESMTWAAAISHTPWAFELPNPDSPPPTVVGWDVAAQTHYSFFQNLEQGKLSRYYFGSGEDHAWSLWYRRYNINLMAIRGSHVLMRPIWNLTEVNGKKPMTNDERLLTEIVPLELDMPALIATRAISSHFSFRNERNKMLQTDLLDRYIAYANEMVCTSANQKKRFGPQLGPHHLPSTRQTGEQMDGSNAHGTNNDKAANVIEDGPGEVANIGDGPGEVANVKADEETMVS